MLFGHRRGGILSKNQIINAAIQGSAFHCLLWAAIQAIALIEREGLETRIPGQIHDEIVSFIWPSEEAYYIRALTRIMEEDVRKFNPRISVPLLAEWAVGAVDAPWLDKKSIPPNEMEAYLARL
jgi:DNA polymerase I-like protein with 3'-5' exonuclease and polymerase domains